VNYHSKAVASRERAAALIIVLAFVVLFAGLGVAYLTRTTSDRQVANSSLKQSNVDQLAQSAMDNIIGDLRQEILNGSGSPSPTASPVSLFVPTSSANMVPMRNNTLSSIPNLIRRSLRSETALWPDQNVGPAVRSRASGVNSYSDVSANGRSISLSRWNSHYLIPKLNPGTADSIPINAFAGVTPDWVFVAPDPNNQNQEWRKVITAPDQTVIGRYAYTIYDEGGLLDMNAAGYPSPTTILQYGRKGSLAFADLTSLGGFTTTSADNLVGWRNYASSQPTGTLASNFSFSADSTNTYYNFILSGPNSVQLSNYLVNGSPALTYFTNSFLTTSQAPAFNNRTDQPMAAREELINLRSGVSSPGISFTNALQYVGTFSREALANIPQWSPTTPNSVNPNFQTLLVTQSFVRNDGTTANIGDSLVNKRFLLQRLNWLTYKGPSASRTIPTSAPSLGDLNYDMWLLTRGALSADENSIRFGLTTAFLRQGTDLSIPGSTANTSNIYKYFGLVWDITNERWNYIGHPANPTATSPLATSIATFGVGGTQTATREPDFFELLQAGIINSSLGDASSSDPALPLIHQQSTMLHVLTIGANLIAQSRADSYPVRIACNVGGTAMEAVGMPRLPCVSSLAACPIGGTGPTGGVNWLLIPNLWDPFRDTWDLTEQNAGNTGNKPLSTPGYLRPPVRITIKGNVTFAAASVSQSGSVDPGSISQFQPPVSTGSFNASLTLATGSNAFGRDGLLSAMRLGTSDISGTLTLLDPTQSPPVPPLPTPAPQWYRVHPPTNDNSPYRSDDYVVFRLALSGASILPTNIIFGQRPVLILQPGFQVSLDYQSPNGNWYPYSFLQGVNDNANPPITWITAGPRGPLTIGTSYSEYGTNLAQPPPPSALPTVINLGPLPVGTPTPWSDVTGGLGHAPMFAKSDPRSIRYNSMIGVVNVANPPLSFNSAGVIGSIWPNSYTAPPSMSPSAFPTPTPTPNPNPASLGDNALAGNTANPYNETSGDTWRPVMMNRPFRSVGEMGYAFRDQPFRTLSFSSVSSPDAGLLDLFTTNDYSDPSGMRGGVVNLNSRQAPVLAAVLTNTVRREDTPRTSSAAPSPSPSPLASPAANSIATSLTSSTTTTPLVDRADLATLIAYETGLGASAPKTQRECIARALGETGQTRTWNLLIDVIAQSGRYPPNATSLANGFVVAGEQRYWVHVAIDRFTGQVIDKQIEVVNE
jgi:hypothetical protein